nr:unnamed protein product [Callosobruchus analis]
MKKRKRGHYDHRKIEDKNIIIVKWHDNSIVTLCSNSAGVNPIHSVKRFCRKERKIMVQQPHLVNLYNANMGGVDRYDQNISLYRTSIRGKKWYFPLITHLIDTALQNAWQLHRARGGNLDQLGFRRRIATTLLLQNKKQSTSRGHMSKDEGIDIRFDHIDHLVIPQDKQTRCAQCHDKTTTRCIKCDRGLHVKCFVVYHTPRTN